MHPAAELFPEMSDAQLDELAADIKKNGLCEPLTFFEDNSSVDSPVYLLDGRIRKAALKRLGCNDLDDIPRGNFVSGGAKSYRIIAATTVRSSLFSTGALSEPKTVPNVDPFAAAVSLNLQRRHLTAEQKHAVIEKLKAHHPNKSNRAIAKLAGVSDKTVAEVSQNAEIPQNGTPTEKAATVGEQIATDPTKSIREIAKETGVSKSAVARTRKQIAKTGAPQPRKKPLPLSASPSRILRQLHADPKPMVGADAKRNSEQCAAITVVDHADKPDSNPTLVVSRIIELFKGLAKERKFLTTEVLEGLQKADLTDGVKVVITIVKARSEFKKSSAGEVDPPFRVVPAAEKPPAGPASNLEVATGRDDDTSPNLGES